MKDIDFKKIEENIKERLNVSETEMKNMVEYLIKVSVIALEEYHLAMKEAPDKD
ncbi:hypothetical protein ACIQXG_19520 [Lysinibacillus sphaericus]|uniref:hypothetical protein n=1 Tax=Lysinibacillus sphaericus TaxID=1421 RepID=UPI003830D98D